MPFSREHLLRDCRLAADALEFAQLGIRKGLEDRLHALWDSHLYRNHHASAKSERDLFEVREPGLVVPVKRLDAAIKITRKATDRLLAEHRGGRSSLVRLTRAAAALRAAMGGVAVAQKMWDPATEARNRYIYEQVMEGTPLRSIMKAVNGHEGWEPIGSETGVKDRAVTYAKRRGLTRPKPRRARGGGSKPGGSK